MQTPPPKTLSTPFVSVSWFNKASTILSRMCSKLLSCPKAPPQAILRSNSLKTSTTNHIDPGISRANTCSRGKPPRENKPASQKDITCNARPGNIRRHMRLTKDFDHMLENGFSKLNPASELTPPEYTIYITLTPEVARDQLPYNSN
ncbi:hypothetical protein DSO57_1007521 [Entomophthora muscae]|uniref:Uncharacterized protein n=1 Tax=Entomophthora muscae TaxID=34485 RepID=A0ACC2UGY1_9FUNG|nr:hypothetical protein DSO57_1007521 [Entomophthora muscae]